MSVEQTLPVAVDPARQLLDGLEALVRRHRALHHDAAADLHVELIAAEVAQQLAVTRRALCRGRRDVSFLV